MPTIVVLALASILFLSVLLITGALMMRGQWDKLNERGSRSPSRPEQRDQTANE